MKLIVLLSEVFGRIYDGLYQNVGKKGYFPVDDSS